MSGVSLWSEVEKVRSENYYGVPKQIAEDYIESLVYHIRCVWEAAEMLSAPHVGITLHDESKFSPIEFVGYAMHFNGGGDPSGFARAWLHHLHFNPHHWNHWCHPGDDYHVAGSDMEKNVLPMPTIFAIEMVADWMGANRAYTGLWDMTDWLAKNWHRIKLHSVTRKYVADVLWELGYDHIVNTREAQS